MFVLLKYIENLQITTVTKYTNRDGYSNDDRIVTSTVFSGKENYQQFNRLTNAQFQGTLNNLH